MHSGPFGCLTKLSAKWAELVLKFVERSRIRIFHNERIQSTPLDPILTFWCVSYYLGAFGTVWLPYETRCTTGRTSAKVRATKSRQNFRNERTQSTPLDPKLTFWCISNYFGAFGTVWLLTKLGAKRAELVQNSCQEVASEFFATNAPDPTHWSPN